MQWTTLVAMSALAGLTPAQEPGSGDEASPARDVRVMRELTVQNLAPFARSEWVQAVVPFAEGSTTGLPELHVEGRPTVWEPFGARWPDGSLRQALCLFRAELARFGELRAVLTVGAGPEAEVFRAALPEYTLEIVAHIEGERIAAQLTEVEVLTENAARRVSVLRGRLGATGLVAEATLEVYSGQPHAWFGIGVFFSDPTTARVQLPIQSLSVESTGLAFVPRHTDLLGTRPEPTETGCRTILLENSHLADGQGVRRVGALVPPLREDDGDDARSSNETIRAALVCRPLGATTWTDSLAFGPFGAVPPPPPWLASPAAVREAMGRRHTEFVQWSRTAGADPFRPPRHGLDTAAHRAGDQPDFGLCALEPVAATGLPSFLFEVEWSVMQEGCRPVHFFEADGSPIAARAHPQWVALAGRTHWNQGASPDRLGKAYPAERHDAHNWTGIDSEHWSNNYLCAYYLLTADPQALLEIRSQCQLWIAANTLDPNLWTSGPGAARAAGRTILSACWLWLCSPDPALAQRARDRMYQTMVPGWSGGQWPPERVRPYDVKGPDPRYFPGDESVWAPWEDALATTGFAAYRTLFRDESPEIVRLVDGLALNLLRHAWRIAPDGRADVGYAMKYFDGVPYTAEQYADPLVVKWPSASFGVWALGSLVVARRAASRLGDDALVARADELLAALHRLRPRPRDGFWDRFSQWSAIR